MIGTNDAAPRRRSAYGPRGRLGLIVPPTNTVNEAEWARMSPKSVTVHVQRMPLHADIASPEGRARLEADLNAAVAMLAPCEPDAVAYACTAGSTVVPARSLPDALTARSGLPVVTTACAILDALTALGARRVAVATPYEDRVNAHEAAFLDAHGIEVLRIAGLGIGPDGPRGWLAIAETPLGTVEAHARAAFAPGAEALLIACTDFPTLPLIDRLEADLGVPVVTSNTATLWAALVAAGIDPRGAGAGRLFAAPPPDFQGRD